MRVAPRVTAHGGGAQQRKLARQSAAEQPPRRQRERRPQRHGRIVLRRPGLRQFLQHGDFAKLANKIVTVRVADTRFVIDQLAALHAGRNPDAGHRPLPTGLAGAMDMNRVGMFGVSAGGFTAWQAMDEDHGSQRASTSTAPGNRPSSGTA